MERLFYIRGISIWNITKKYASIWSKQRRTNKMTPERLEQLLSDGYITQEEYDAMSKPSGEPAPEAANEPEQEQESEAARRLRQSQLDREMAKERKKNVELERKIKRLESQILSEEDQRKIEFEEQQKELEEQRRELAIEKNKMYAMKAMKKASMGDSEETLSLIEKIVLSCEDEADIDDTIALLKAWHDKAVTAEVDKRFKEGGYTPKKGNSLNGGKNPFAKGQFNLTEQMRLLSENPELAAQLQAEAGS